jgi:hypothetical protein
MPLVESRACEGSHVIYLCHFGLKHFVSADGKDERRDERREQLLATEVMNGQYAKMKIVNKYK